MAAEAVLWRKHDHLYRRGVGIMLLSHDNRVFVGKRVDVRSNAWQMPQGGIELGEDELLAANRELQEETGVTSAELIAVSRGYFYYNLPYQLQKKFWGGKFIGQKQRWFLMRFTGDDSEVQLATGEVEFVEWQWAMPQNLPNIIVAFKQNLYNSVIDEFKDYIPSS